MYKHFLLYVATASCFLLFTTGVSYSQSRISVDINNVIKNVAPNSIGINVNYLMDGSFISAGTTAATAASLKKMGMKILRYPGGEKSDNYRWSSPPYLQSSPSTLLTGSCQWPSMDSRFAEPDRRTLKPAVLDFDEFMVMCRETGAEPMVVCAYDAAYYGGNIESRNPCGIKPTKQQLIELAKEWVRYANTVKGYGVKYWSIGNESWKDCTYNGCVNANQYAADIVEFATAMRSVDPSVKIIVNGVGEDWWRTLLQNQGTADLVDYFGVSCYPVNTYTGGYEYYRNNNPQLIQEINDATNAIDRYASATNKARIKVLVTETNSVDWIGSWPSLNDVGHALVACEILARCFQNTSVESALFWNTRWTNNTTGDFDLFDALDKNSDFNANGLLLSAWAGAILPRMVQTTDEGFIKAFAFHDNNRSRLNTILINKDNVSRPISLSVPGMPPEYSCVKWEFKGSGTNDTRPTYLAVDSFNSFVSPLSISLPANSVTILKFSPQEILPVLHFKGSLRVNLTQALTAQLKWATGNAGNAVFKVQKSTDGTNWTTVGQVKASFGGSNQYTFEDIEPFRQGSRVYYRIMEESSTGQVYYSDSKTIQNSKLNELRVRLLSNPVEKRARFEIITDNQVLKEVVVTDAIGNVVKKFGEQGVNSVYSFNLEDVPAGLYFFQFVGDRNRKTVKVLKL